MANPVVTNIPEWQWVKIASGIKGIKLSSAISTVYYYYTYRLSGEDAPDIPTKPTDTDAGVIPDEAVRMFDLSQSEEFKSSEPIDIYIMCANSDRDSADTGKIIIGTVHNNVDTNRQDQSTPSVEHFMYQELNDIVITGTPTRGTNILTLEAGHGFSVLAAPNKEYLNIHYVDTSLPGVLGTRFSQHAVVDVDGNDISITPPIAHDLDSAKVEFSKRVNVNMAILGTFASPIKFITYPPNGQKWHLTRMIIDMIMTSGGDDGKFGNLTALTNGEYFGFENPVFAYYALAVFDNGGWRASAYDVEYITRSGGGGDFSLAVRKTSGGEDKLGVVIELDGSTLDSFVKYTQDDLQLLGRYRIKIMGHLVLD